MNATAAATGTGTATATAAAAADVDVASTRSAATRCRRLPATVALALLLGAVSPARAEIDVQLSGRLQTDLRLRINEKDAGDWYAPRGLQRGVSRNENIAKVRLEVDAGRFFGVAEIDFVWVGIQRDVAGLDDLFSREKLEAYRLEAHALYVEATDLLLEGLDLRIGQQKVAWGKGDQFNPTNTINPDDFEDQLLFGEQMANAMVRLDYNPTGNWTFSAVLVPVFKAALLPRTGDLALAATDRMPFVEEALRHRLSAERAFAADLGNPTVVDRALPVLPETRLDNMQGALRVAGTVGEQDVALSYYVGRSDVPQPYANYSYLDPSEARCRIDDPTVCIDGLIKTEVALHYPRMQVVGFNMAGQLNLLGWITSKIKPLGYRIELGVYLPQQSSIVLLQDRILTQPPGEYDYGLGGRRPLTVDDTPYAKWVVGLDYTFNRYLYVNLQWVHGMADEVGAGDFLHEGWAVGAGSVDPEANLFNCALGSDPKGAQCAIELLRPRLGDYLVLGVDVKALGDHLLARLFMILALNGIYEQRWDETAGQRVQRHRGPFSADGFSAVVFPEVTYNFGHGFDLGVGALLKFGKSHTKFGDPAAGGSTVWSRARLSF